MLKLVEQLIMCVAKEYQHKIFLMRKAVILLLPWKNTPKQENLIQQNFVDFTINSPGEC